ncbi:MAG: magnesium chelatase, partial [Clostridia bacterium]|nr:magnesium chelatase [Clostridia bacterium]
TDSAKDLVTKAFDFYGLTARSYDRLLRTAQTVADLEGKDEIDELIIAEVISYRTAEKKYFFRG